MTTSENLAFLFDLNVQVLPRVLADINIDSLKVTSLHSSRMYEEEVINKVKEEYRKFIEQKAPNKVSVDKQMEEIIKMVNRRS